MLIDASFEGYGTYRSHSDINIVRNILVIGSLSRSDLNSVIQCHASNTNLIVPLRRSVQLDMNCK